MGGSVGLGDLQREGMGQGRLGNGERLLVVEAEVVGPIHKEATQMKVEDDSNPPSPGAVGSNGKGGRQEKR
ncbi:hypothetical protein BHE74_00002733 [Ensete ventricosum]|nr:hypothetical protein GW17_00056755 [Ensete ventricosum]RWW88388.1 hypothetical protein BHE74_00002733 [Ensete ventricosum]RZS02095.1 hypothetical protein BHM03_00032074 [Ensete ventricosum]